MKLRSPVLCVLLQNATEQAAVVLHLSACPPLSQDACCRDYHGLLLSIMDEAGLLCDFSVQGVTVSLEPVYIISCLKSSLYVRIYIKEVKNSICVCKS